MSLNLPSDLDTAQDFIPAAKRSAVAKMPVPQHFETLAALNAAVVKERANIGMGLGIWLAGTPITLAVEPGIRRSWVVNGASSHARLATLPGGRSLTLGADSNTITFADGIPASSTGANGDVSVDLLNNGYWTKGSSAWALTGQLVTVPAAAGVVLTDFSLNGDFTATRRMPKAGFQTQTTSLPFNFPDTNAVEDNDTTIYLQANGSPITADGFVGSEALALVKAGDKIRINLSYSGGLRVCAVQVLVAAAALDTTKPQVSAASVANGTPTVINITFNEAMDVTVPSDLNNLAVSGKTVTGRSFVDSTHANLTVSSAFTNGASASLGYSLPGSGGLHDVAGNVLDAFSGTAIVNNVASSDSQAPQVASASVENGTPNVVNLTFNEAMRTTVMPPASAWSVGGHTVTAFAWVDASHANLTLSAPFLYGEAARPLGYAVPASPNQTQGLAGNWLDAFTGGSIVNNVAASSGTNVSDSFDRANSDTSAGPLWTAMNGAVFGVLDNKAVLKAFKTTGPRGGIWTECGSAYGTLDLDVVNDQYAQGTGPILRRVSDDAFMWLVLGGDRIFLRVTQGGLGWTVKTLVGGSYPYSQTTHIKVVMAAAVNPTDPVMTISATGGADMVITKADFDNKYDDGAGTQGAPLLTTGTKHGCWDNPGSFDNFAFVKAA